MPDPRTVTFCGIQFDSPILGIIPVGDQFVVVTADRSVWRVYQETYRVDGDVWRRAIVWTV